MIHCDFNMSALSHFFYNDTVHMLVVRNYMISKNIMKYVLKLKIMKSILINECFHNRTRITSLL